MRAYRPSMYGKTIKGIGRHRSNVLSSKGGQLRNLQRTCNGLLPRVYVDSTGLVKREVRFM